MRNASIKKFKEDVCSPKHVSSHSYSHDVMTMGVTVPSSPFVISFFPPSVYLLLSMNPPTHIHLYHSVMCILEKTR